MRDYRKYFVKVVDDSQHVLVTVCITRARTSKEALATVARRNCVKALTCFTLTIITKENYAELIRVWEEQCA